MRDGIPVITRFLAMRRDAFFRAMAASIGQLGCVAVPLFLLAALIVQPARAQTQKVVIDCLPPWETNNRFMQSTRIKHPGLSLNGFDCGDNCDIGYGLKQVLEKVYGDQATTDPEVQDIFGKMVRLVAKPLKDKEIDNNSAILQSRSFVALASYVLENNDYDPTVLNPALPSAKVAINNFRMALLQYDRWKMHEDITDDGVKWTESVTNVARTIDFYLALENAYEHYNVDEFKNEKSTSLLSLSQKYQLMGYYSDLILNLNGTARKVGGFASRFRFESGNAPLKIQIAAAYSAFAWQPPKLTLLNIDELILTKKIIDDFIPRAFKAAGIPTIKDRDKYWHYQSDNGKYFWAEGAYYFHITLSDIIPFWHATRINNILSNTSLHPYNFADPFRQSWLLNPLHWLSDISTPDGKTPPLDDGNKSTMYNAGILRWKSEYGDDTVGEKFARVVGAIKAVNGYSLQKALYPVAISIPRRSVTVSTLPDGIIGNEFDHRTDGEDGRQEVVVRRTINGRQHYVFLNGESGDAIVRGEDHEQGDQMQLLYYIDDTSYLVDSGYDRPVPPDFSLIPPSYKNWRRSTWNNYYDHNVMTMEPNKSGWHDNRGGVRSPFLNIIEIIPGITDKARIQSHHQDVNEIYYQNHGNIDLLSANINLSSSKKKNQENSDKQEWANYQRNILFIRDANNPYLVDINSISGDKQDTQNWYKMYYHGNSNTISDRVYYNRPIARQWVNLYKSKNSLLPKSAVNTRLYIQPFSVERNLYSLIDSDTIREQYLSQERGVGINVKRLIINGNAFNNDTSKENFTSVAFIHALSTPTKIELRKENRLLPGASDRNWQYYTWLRDSSTVDVVVSRSAKYYVNPLSFSGFNRNLLHLPIPEADSFYVGLPSNMNYGFARLIKEKNIWNIDPIFQLNLEKSVPQVTISGPSCIAGENSTGYYSSSTSGGKPPYSYSWSFYRFCIDANSDAISSASLGPKCNAWNSIGSTIQAKFGGYNGQDFKIRLTLTDSSSPRQSATSSELPVRVLSSMEGSCPSDTPEDIPGDVSGKRGMDSAQPLALNESLSEAKKSIPEAYALRQNFPNPFNPSTDIVFDLPETAMVSLIVYDVLGREVARLVERELPAGTHRARFDAGSLPSGVYLYRIQAGDFMDTSRMLLLK